MTLDELKPGEAGIITKVGGAGQLRLRLLDMGLIPHTRVCMCKAAPLGDPVEISLRGYSVTLRLSEAHNIAVEKEETL